MGKIPYLFRRNNVFYFRLVVPTELRSRLKFPQITISLKTQESDEAIPKALMMACHLKSYLHDVKQGIRIPVERSELITKIYLMSGSQISSSSETFDSLSIPEQVVKTSAPLLSLVIEYFLSRYNPRNRATLIKLKSTLPILLGLVGNKSISAILQADIALR